MHLALSEAAKAIVSKLRGEQEAKRILDFHIVMPDGTSISVKPSRIETAIQVTFKDGKTEVLVLRNMIPAMQIILAEVDVHRKRFSGDEVGTLGRSRRGSVRKRIVEQRIYLKLSAIEIADRV
jgi:uncharacterized protein with PIN domain